jgi:hypothetical protein
VCDTALGPCEKRTAGQPILASTEGEAGTGGASVVTGPAGDHWLAYHAWTPGAIGYDSGGARSLRFASLTWEVDQLAVTRQTPPTPQPSEAMADGLEEALLPEGVGSPGGDGGVSGGHSGDEDHPYPASGHP